MFSIQPELGRAMGTMRTDMDISVVLVKPETIININNTSTSLNIILSH